MDFIGPFMGGLMGAFIGYALLCVLTTLGDDSDFE